jgi:cytochrome P450
MSEANFRRYEDMFIPKGAKVVLSQWALHFDDQRFPDPWPDEIPRIFDRFPEPTSGELYFKATTYFKAYGIF